MKINKTNLESIPEKLPLLPIRDVVIFPYMILPLFVGRESSIAAVEEALKRDRLIFLTTQKNIHQEIPTPDALYEVGTVGMIMRMRKLPDGRLKLLVQGLNKAKIAQFDKTDPFFEVSFSQLIEEPDVKLTEEVVQTMNEVKLAVNRLASLGKIIPPDMAIILEEIQEPGRLADIVASNLGLKVPESQLLLETSDPIFRLNLVLEYLKKEQELIQIQNKMRDTRRQDPQQNPNDFPPRDPYQGMGNPYEADPKMEEIAEIRFKLEQKKLPKEIETEAMKQLSRLERMHPDASESGIIRTYLDWVIDIPWSEPSKDSHNLVKAKDILDKDHYGLDKIKDRILEFLAVSSLKHKMKGPILCFVGAPGVGKTSLGKSIAHCLNRKFVRMSLGGVRDEAEIRGHRRTYVGAMPGKILQGLKHCGTNNPVFVLDEIDKLGSDFRGDPASALLEVLDPEQNHEFKDHYLNLPFDLSNVMFIATANVMDTIPPPLRDRMEVINLAGYTENEKLQISKRHLIKKQIKENGLNEKDISFTSPGLMKLIRDFTREAGLRTLERKIGSVCRKIAKNIALKKSKSGVRSTHTVSITAEKVEKLLGQPIFKDDVLDFTDKVGVATGLAWTPFGGEVLQIEAVRSPSKNGTLLLTGQLGDIMKESARAATSFIQANADTFHINPDDFHHYDIHVHVPAGAQPKDGPSAGVTIATTILSLMAGIPIRHDVAMTGEITLKGRVLPIGGIKEKLLAAMRYGIKEIIVPHANHRDIVEIPAEYKKSIKIHEVKNISEVFDLALVKTPFRKPSKLTKIAEAA
jgi:ATP-dependent Lon protease